MDTASAREENARKKMPLTDLHCHILPGIDDGARTVDDSLSLIKRSSEQGVKNFVFTPHFYPEEISPESFAQRRDAAERSLRAALEGSGMSDIRYRVGAEIAYTPMLAEMPLEKLCYSGTRYLLLELLAMYEPVDVEGLIYRLRDRGYTPILAHIERFSYISDDPTLLYKWVSAGALAQVNAGWAMRDSHAKRRIEKLFDWNLVHFMASDTHSIERRPPNLPDGYSLLPENIAAAFKNNADAVFAGRDINAARPQKPVYKLGRWR